jgi:hypothetical protein
MRDSVPLDAIVIPLPAHGGNHVQLCRLSPVDAVIALGMFPRVPGVLDRELLGRQFKQVAALAKQIPVFTGTIPWSPSHRRSSAAELVAALGWDPLEEVRTAGWLERGLAAR